MSAFSADSAYRLLSIRYCFSEARKDLPPPALWLKSYRIKKDFLGIVLLRSVLMKMFIYTKLLNFFLKLDNWVYSCISKLAVRKHSGIHPKHQIIQYEHWFLDHITSTDRVLDIGSHDGSMCFILSNKAQVVMGIEIEEPKYEKAIKRNHKPNVTFMLGDATTLILIEKFNIITLSNVLEHIEKRVDFLNKILEHHKPERILIRVPLITREWVSVYKKNIGIDFRLDPTHYIEYTEADLKAEILAAKMRISSMEVRFGEAFLVCVPN
jgi:hypothetical protein